MAKRNIVNKLLLQVLYSYYIIYQLVK